MMRYDGWKLQIDNNCGTYVLHCSSLVDTGWQAAMHVCVCVCVCVCVSTRDGSSTFSEVFVLCLYENILTTIHAMTKSFLPFCSAQDGESTDMNCLVFWTRCENGKILTKCQVYNKGIFTDFGYFFIVWKINIIRIYSWFLVEWCN